MRPLEQFKRTMRTWRRKFRFLRRRMAKIRAPVELWEPIAGHISDKEWQLVMDFCHHRCRTRDWRKMNILRSYRPRPVTAEQFRKEFGTLKGWTQGRFEFINRQLRKGFKEDILPFRCRVIFKNGGYKLSKMVPVQ